jgi:hypothetical protein
MLREEIQPFPNLNNPWDTQSINTAFSLHRFNHATLMMQRSSNKPFDSYYFRNLGFKMDGMGRVHMDS